MNPPPPQTNMFLPFNVTSGPLEERRSFVPAMVAAFYISSCTM